MNDAKLSERDCGLVREHLDEIVEREMALPGFVYPRLYAKSPAARTLFDRYSDGAQRRMFADTVVAILDLIDGDGWVSPDLEGLGSRHRHVYSVDEPMYDAWADSVVEGIAEAIGPSFTSDHALAWRKALELTNETMRAGSAYPKRDAPASR